MKDNCLVYVRHDLRNPENEDFEGSYIGIDKIESQDLGKHNLKLLSESLEVSCVNYNKEAGVLGLRFRNIENEPYNFILTTGELVNDFLREMEVKSAEELKGKKIGGFFYETSCGYRELKGISACKTRSQRESLDETAEQELIFKERAKWAEEYLNNKHQQITQLKRMSLDELTREKVNLKSDEHALRGVMRAYSWTTKKGNMDFDRYAACISQIYDRIEDAMREILADSRQKSAEKRGLSGPLSKIQARINLRESLDAKKREQTQKMAQDIMKGLDPNGREAAERYIRFCEGEKTNVNPGNPGTDEGNPLDPQSDINLEDFFTGDETSS